MIAALYQTLWLRERAWSSSGFGGTLVYVLAPYPTESRSMSGTKSRAFCVNSSANGTCASTSRCSGYTRQRGMSTSFTLVSDKAGQRVRGQV